MAVVHISEGSVGSSAAGVESRLKFDGGASDTHKNQSSHVQPNAAAVLPFAIPVDSPPDAATAGPSDEAHLISSMGHSFRTPLNQILGFSELLTEQLSGPLNDKQQRQADGIYRAGERLLAVVNDLVLLAEVATGAEGMDAAGKADLIRCLGEWPKPAADLSSAVDIEGSLPAEAWVAVSEPWLDRLSTALISAVRHLAGPEHHATLACTESDGRVPAWALTVSWTMPVADAGSGGIRWFDFASLAAYCEKRVHGSGVQFLLAQRIASAVGGTVLAHTDGDTRFSVDCVLPRSQRGGP